MSIYAMSTKKDVKRGPGRPPRSGKSNDGLVSRDLIIARACDAARTRAVADVSFVSLAKELGVRPGAIHYHIGTKDALISAILNSFYAELLSRLKQNSESDDWRSRVRQFAKTLMICQSEHKGAAEHLQAHAKFRIFQKIEGDDIDHGARYLDYAFSLFRDIGFNAETGTMFYHMLALHCLSTATSRSSQLEPMAHEDFLLDRANSYVAETMPGLNFGLRAFARIRSEDAFEQGVDALVEHFSGLRDLE